MPYEDEGKKYVAQLGIYSNELIKYPTLLVDITGMNRPHQFNEFSYKINRELLKTCPSFQDQFTLMPLSKILDIEGLFNDKQYDSLENILVSVINSKKTNVVLATMDDPYPYSSMSKYTTSQGKSWNVGGRYDKGGLLIVLSRNYDSIDLYIAKELDANTESNVQELFKNINMSDNNPEFFKELIEALNGLKEIL